MTQTVNKDPVRITLRASPRSAVVGKDVTFTATVTAKAPGSGHPSGTVDFYDSGTWIGRAPLSITLGFARFTTSALPVGSNSITASYSGDSDFLNNNSSPVIVDNQYKTSTVVTSSLNPSDFGQSVTFTAAVTGVASGNDVPTGKAKFFDGSTVLGTVPLVDGEATFTTSALAVGDHPIVVEYLGDLDYKGSWGAILQTVKPGPHTMVGIRAALSVDEAIGALTDITADDSTVSALALDHARSRRHQLPR